MDTSGRGFDRPRPVDAHLPGRDRLAQQEPSLGLAALHSPADPEPSLRIQGGSIVELDGRRREDFDIIDAFIADHGIDLAATERAMTMPAVEAARLLVDPNVPRGDVLAVVAGMSPAKLAAVVRQVRPAELPMALTKMRARRTPSTQAQVTNRLDDPLLLAADAATAVAHGFRELSTTSPVVADAPSNALALLIGSQVGRPGALTNCACEESAELRLGMRGLVGYAETITLQGTQGLMVDGDDTPWSKAFLVAAYASRGVKVRVRSGGGSQALAGQAGGASMLYLEARCVSLAKALGAQGVRNGGAASAALAAALPNGVRELHYENLMAMMRGLESSSGNDSVVSASQGRRFARTLPALLAGSDFVAGGFGAVPAYDNMFGPGNLDGDDLDDYLVLQRDWGADGGLRTVPPQALLAVRRQAAEACRAVYSWLGLADFSDEHVEAVVQAAGSRSLPQDIGLAVLAAARTIDQQALTGLDVAVALEETGYSEEAERVLAMLAERVRGDYLQPAAIFDESLRCLSAVTDPNDYAGPGTGYEPGPDRRRELAAVRGERTIADVQQAQDEATHPGAALPCGPATRSHEPRDVVIAVSPAFAKSIWTTLSGLGVLGVLDEILAGLEEEGCQGRVVRCGHTLDLGRIGYSGSALAGSGIAVALQGTGAVLVTRRGMGSQTSLESLPSGDGVDADLYRQIGVNAARHAKGSLPEPIRVLDGPSQPHDQLTIVTYVALENEQVVPGTSPEQLEVLRE